ncbi:hypothetical protein F2Q70_00001753 [Brassica cretica]|uniref:Uncharacterized protein n=1 Tax=Brassica cretica TaxID=69181 RepID=A0A8S9J279_BRACR|nr:hypothetical protein F2Q70_00001753 [Brassica cretica]KAF3564223.1 hypothetical protein DY000_02012881 [Brassica cretica]
MKSLMVAAPRPTRKNCQKKKVTLWEPMELMLTVLARNVSKKLELMRKKGKIWLTDTNATLSFIALKEKTKSNQR